MSTTLLILNLEIIKTLLGSEFIIYTCRKIWPVEPIYACNTEECIMVQSLHFHFSGFWKCSYINQKFWLFLPYGQKKYTAQPVFWHQLLGIVIHLLCNYLMYIKSYDDVSSHSSRAAHLEKKIFEALLYSLNEQQQAKNCQPQPFLYYND